MLVVEGFINLYFSSKHICKYVSLRTKNLTLSNLSTPVRIYKVHGTHVCFRVLMLFKANAC